MAKAGDEHMGAWVYCTQHVRPHTTGWCTIGVRDKIALRAETYEEAADEVRAAGWHIYNTDDGLPHLRDFDDIRESKERHEKEIGFNPRETT